MCHFIASDQLVFVFSQISIPLENSVIIQFQKQET